MSDGFPDQGQSTVADEEPEEDSDNNGQLLDVVAIDIYVDEETDEGGGADERAPVPLPATADGVEASINGEMEAAVLGQSSKGEDKANTESDGHTNASVSTGSNRVDGAPALGCIDPAAVLVEDGGLNVGQEGQVAAGAIGDGVVAVEGVVPVAEGGEVELVAVEEGLVLVCALGEGTELPGDEEIPNRSHGGQGCIGRLSVGSIGGDEERLQRTREQTRARRYSNEAKQQMRGVYE